MKGREFTGFGELLSVLQSQQAKATRFIKRAREDHNDTGRTARFSDRGKANQVHSLDAEKWNAIFQRKEVLDRIVDTHTTEINESGFVLRYNQFTGEYLPTTFQQGEQNRMTRFHWELDIPNKFRSFAAMVYHSHHDDVIILPSGLGENGDLWAIYDARMEDRAVRGIDTRPILGTTIFDSRYPKRACYVLLIQEAGEEPLAYTEAKAQMDKVLEAIRPSQRISVRERDRIQAGLVSRIRETGWYNCELVKVDFSDKGKKVFAIEDLEKIALTFEYTPRIINVEKCKSYFELE